LRKKVDTKAKPPFPRQTAQWWFDCQAASRKNKRPSSRSGSLVKEDIKSVYIGNGDSNDMDYQLDSNQQTPASVSSVDAHIVKVDKEDKEWKMHGRPDSDELVDDSTVPSLSSISCKTNRSLILIFLFITIFKYVFYGSASGERP
jgi:hypothetical protein